MKFLNQKSILGVNSILLIPALIMSTGCSNREEKKTNIIMFLVDDMGWQDTSIPFYKERTPFNERYHTPNMERLASEGMMFTQTYACSVCSPTRVSLMTGINATRHRVTKLDSSEKCKQRSSA